MAGPRYAMGWQRDIPDVRDYTPEHDEVAKFFVKSRAMKGVKAGIGATCDLSGWCSPIEDQGALGSCTAQAGAGLIEYYERRATGKHLDASRLFLYKVTRNLLHWTGDTGALLRTTMKGMVLFGVPPEEYHQYNIATFDREPTAFCYAFAQSYQSVRYYRHDPAGTPGSQVVSQVKAFLAAGYPSMFGFPVYSYGNAKGEFPYPGPGDSLLGGHAVVAVGYDDNRMIAGKKGALKIRNSWGTGWGEAGYGWLPYAYVQAGLANDFWSLMSQEYVDSGKFE